MAGGVVFRVARNRCLFARRETDWNEIATPPESQNGTILFITGHSSHHFDVLKLLTSQAELPLFLGNAYCEVLYQQRVPLSAALRSGLSGLLDEAVRRDALIRMTGHYDPAA